MKIRMVLLSVLVIASFVMLVPVGVLAQAPAGSTNPTGGSPAGSTNPSYVPADFQICNPLSDNCTGGGGTIEDILDKVINFILLIAAPIAALMYVWAGFMFLTAGGDPKKIDQAKKAVLWTSIGIGVLVISKGLVIVVQDILTP
ncbi:MAG: pilin [Candidatus Colwellbacteria bacterium]|nr:pilin [Candidatus Colwellbacteria bacterium]